MGVGEAKLDVPEARNAAPGHLVPTAPVWDIDPTEFALGAAELRRTAPGALPEPLCTEVGRRLLWLQFRFSRWVLRRVEKVEFDHDRRVIRRTTIELSVPPEAPELVVGGSRYWLVPLSVMRRRTLVNLDLGDEQGNTIRMLGLRFTQASDEAMLRAAAFLALEAVEVPNGRTDAESEEAPQERPETLPTELSLLIRDVVSGTRLEIESAKLRVRDARGDALNAEERRRVIPLKNEWTREILRNRLFAATLERLWHNFTLYALLPVKLGRQRLIRLSVDEPTGWKIQKPKLVDGERETAYRPFATRARLPVLSVIGLKPVRLRFLTPSAENCTSYHFEFTAPPGVRIARATLLAGRPQPGTPSTVGNGVTVDDVTPRGPTAGLHAVEVPNGSLCRAQIDLMVPSQGWLGTLLAAAFACLIVVASVLVHAEREGGNPDHWSAEQVTNIVLLLATVSAGSATYVAHQHAHDIAAKMVRGLRFIGAFMMAIPALVAGGLVYLGESEAARTWQAEWLLALQIAVACAASCWLIVSLAWLAALRSQSKHRVRSSWDLTDVEATSTVVAVDNRTYRKAMEDLGFKGPAIGFYTAEGWHERYAWDDDKQNEALAALSTEGTNPTRCRCGFAPRSADEANTTGDFKSLPRTERANEGRLVREPPPLRTPYESQRRTWLARVGINALARVSALRAKRHQ